MKLVFASYAMNDSLFRPQATVEVGRRSTIPPPLLCKDQLQASGHKYQEFALHSRSLAPHGGAGFTLCMWSIRRYSLSNPHQLCNAVRVCGARLAGQVNLVLDTLRAPQ